MYIAQPCAPRAQAAQKLSNLHPSPKCWHDISIGLAGFRQYMLFVPSPRHRNPRRTWQPPWREQHWGWPAFSSRASQVRSLRPPPPPLMDSAWSPGEPPVEIQKEAVESQSNVSWKSVQRQLKVSQKLVESQSKVSWKSVESQSKVSQKSVESQSRKFSPVELPEQPRLRRPSRPRRAS